MKKILLLSCLALGACEINNSDCLVYNIRYNPQAGQYGETYWASHGITMKVPIENHYRFIKCYIDAHRNETDGASIRMVQSYDQDTNNVQMYLNDITVPGHGNPYGVQAYDCSHD